MATGAATATATTFDDNIYLSMFFSRVNRNIRPRHIVVGEILGFTALVTISLIGFVAGRLVADAWIGLLGLVPIGVGVNILLARQSHDEEDQPVKRIERSRKPATTRLPRYRLREATRWGCQDQWHQHSLLQTLRDTQTYRVSAVTMANGSNNIAIYLPLFTSSTLPELGIILAVCYAFLALWCLVFYYSLIRQPATATLMANHVQRAVPFVLICLGGLTLLRSGRADLLLGLARARAG